MKKYFPPEFSESLVRSHVQVMTNLVKMYFSSYSFCQPSTIDTRNIIVLIRKLILLREMEVLQMRFGNFGEYYRRNSTNSVVANRAAIIPPKLVEACS